MPVRLSDKYRPRLTPPLPDQIAAHLAAQIQEGAMAPGELLPGEAKLAAQLGVSRSVVREALSRLKYEGLIEAHQGRRVKVVGPRGRRSFRLPPLEQAGPQQLARTYELRMLLEGEAAALAATRRTAADLESLGALLADLEGQAEGQEDTSGAGDEMAFHLGVARASGNAQLADLLHYLIDRLAPVIGEARDHARRQPDLWQRVGAEHRAILDALAQGRANLARAAARDHQLRAAGRLGLHLDPLA